jgi:hypothetical protein
MMNGMFGINNLLFRRALPCADECRPFRALDVYFSGPERAQYPSVGQRPTIL